jgi:hypothetical protein
MTALPTPRTRFASILATALAALACGQAAAETPTIDTTPFVSTRTRAEVRSELPVKTYPWSSGFAEYKAPPPAMAADDEASRTRADVRREFLSSRDEVHALTAEDGGSLQPTIKMHSPTSVMGGSAR